MFLRWMASGLVSMVFAQVSWADPAQVNFQWGVKIPLRDNVQLDATLYTPKDQTTPTPCIFALTPYTSQEVHDRGMYFAGNGYSFLTVDSRGRGNSEGEFQPFIQEARDGYDVVEWLAKQPYCNGKVAMWGGSYVGYDQWATAKEFPPHLSTIVPVASVHPGRDFPMINNIPYPYTMQWLTYVSGRSLQGKIFGDSSFWSSKFRAMYESGTPFKELDVLVGNPSIHFKQWVAHPYVDEFWDTYVPTAEQYAKLDLPILTITGSYDDDQTGALIYYREHMRLATLQAKSKHYLIIGPWDHSGTRRPAAKFGGVKFGSASLVDMSKLHLEWYDWTLKNGPKPEFLRKPVAYYVMGAEKWRYADSLEAITAKSRPYALDSKVNATDVFASGALLENHVGIGKPDGYVYDPRNLSDAKLDATIDADNYLIAQSGILASSGHQFVYQTPVYQKDTEISGFFKLSAWLSIDQPDTDFRATVYEILADGSSILLTTDFKRARYREGLRQPKLVTPGKIQRYDFDSFTFVSRQVSPGSRLRLVIDSINSTSYQRNYNAGGISAEESMKDARPVAITLFHDRKRPSALWIPFGHPQSPNEPTAPPSMFTTSSP